MTKNKVQGPKELVEYSVARINWAMRVYARRDKHEAKQVMDAMLIMEREAERIMTIAQQVKDFGLGLKLEEVSNRPNIDQVGSQKEVLERLERVCNEYEDRNKYVEVKIEVLGLPELGERDLDNYLEVEHYFYTYPDNILRISVYADEALVDILEF